MLECSSSFGNRHGLHWGSRLISIAIDIGGTFTDVVAVDSESGVYHTTKVPTTPSKLVNGVRNGIVEVLSRTSSRAADVGRFVHGTTIGTNAVLEKKGAVTAILTTEGFEDVLEIGRLKRTRMYELFIDAETPIFIAPKRRRRGIRERLGADGTVLTPLDEGQAMSTVKELIDAQGVQAFAVVFLHSFRNPAHEIRMRDLIRNSNGSVAVSISAEVDPMFREYERTVVTAFDAYLRPVIERYLAELGLELREAGLDCGVQIMQSRGGIASAELVGRRPVSVLLSGPAAGVVGGKFAGEQSGFSNLITIDVGGTSADVSLIESGKPLVSMEGKIDTYPLRTPMVDVTTIGAGGGSIAWVDASGGFRVGPQSAGADPGPACYGRGGVDATVTDASVVLGYLNPEYFAGGSLALDADASHRAVERFGARLGLSPIEAAAGIHRVINSKMADAIRLVSIRRGYDPRQFALTLLGGAGPVHGGRLAAELSIPDLVVPAVPGVLSALGLLVASIEHDAIETVTVQADSADTRALEAVFGRLTKQVEQKMAAEKVPAGVASSQRSADMKYVGQSYTLNVPIDARLDKRAIASTIARFHEVHQRIYGHSNPQAPVEFVSLRLVQAWPLPKTAFKAPQNGAGPSEKKGRRSRRAYFDELNDFVSTPVYLREELDGAKITGPAIIEQPDTTLVLYPGHVATATASGNILVKVPPG
jgi:N-methylhydantoinase A